MYAPYSPNCVVFASSNVLHDPYEFDTGFADPPRWSPLLFPALSFFTYRTVLPNRPRYPSQYPIRACSLAPTRTYTYATSA
ncbi:hypothetical protein VTO73DRAFT_985 [Trametes versicolor]